MCARTRPASRGLEGDHRPGHFRAVATVCLKLFNIVRPRRAYFGQKDAQQVEVVRRMIRDLDLDLELDFEPVGDEHRLLIVAQKGRPWMHRASEIFPTGATLYGAEAGKCDLAGYPYAVEIQSTKHP